MIIHDKQLIFIHVPKCAGTSVETYFVGKDWNEVDGDKHLRALHARHKYGRVVWDRYFKFAFVRNPWSRFVSFYNMIHGQQQTDLSFDRWIQQVCSPEGLMFNQLALHLSLADYLCDEKGKLIVDFVGKMETLQVDFTRLLTEIGIQDEIGLPHMLKGRAAGDYRDWYNAQTRQLVAERYQKDLELFRYVF